jgi:hypothetical protein
MRITLLTFATLVVGPLLMPAPAAAHHGWVDFDEKTEVTIEGTVTDFHFVNPHCVVEFDVQDDKGHIRKWQGEFSNPGVLSRKGWNAASLQTGEKLTLTGHPAKDGARAIHVIRIRLPSGEVKLGLEQ